MNKVRFGIIGVGNMGSAHARTLLDGKVPRAVLTAVCDINPDKLKPFPTVKQFADSRALIRSGEVDAVLVATPHYDHTTIGMDALQQGLHVIVEKPISVHVADCERLIAAYKKRPKKSQLFGAMFNQRTDPHYRRTRDLIQAGELGAIKRVVWIITNWFRSEAYYKSGGWRATWRGEGGGVLLNQCPHNLDLLQWLCGMPNKVRAFCHLGKYHDIEVEDDVTAYFEYPNGATGVFITTTGEAPGTNRLEITGDRGKIVLENSRVTWIRTEVPVSEFCRTTKGLFSAPPVWNVEIPVRDHGGQHTEILTNFTNAVLDGTPLLAPAVEGIHSVALANAMLYSSFTGKTVELPLDGRAYERHLKKLIAKSRYKKPEVQTVVADLSSSWGKS
jgi:predicted dehydrogenase